MTETRISGQYNYVLSTIFDPHAKQKLATEESIAVKVFKYLMWVIITAGSLKLTLKCNISFLSFHNTVQSLCIRSQEILTKVIYLPKLKSTCKKSILARGLKLKYKSGRYCLNCNYSLLAQHLQGIFHWEVLRLWITLYI